MTLLLHLLKKTHNTGKHITQVKNKHRLVFFVIAILLELVELGFSERVETYTFRNCVGPPPSKSLCDETMRSN